MRLRRAVPAGLLDTGATSLATFILQAYAVRSLDAAQLGVYALFFTAYVLANLLPQFLVLYPVEIDSLRFPRADRLLKLPASLRLLRPTPLSALLVTSLAFFLSPQSGLRVGLGLTCALAAVSAPPYEHTKRMLHLSDRSWRAARMAGVQLASVVLFLGLAVLADVPARWVPFGVLAGSQVTAFLVGYLNLDWVREKSAALPPIADLILSGRWLLVAGVAPAAATFAAAAIIARLSSSDDLGYAQAAHVAGRPVLVLATGLSTVIGFRLMEAGLSRRRAEGSRYARIFAGLVAVSGVGYAGLVGFDWFGNPLAALLPRAYEIEGLVMVTIGANLLFSLARPPREELLGARQERLVAAVDGSGAIAIILVATMAGTLKGFALPLGVLAGSLVQLAGYLPTRRRLYRRSEDFNPTGEVRDRAADELDVQR